MIVLTCAGSNTQRHVIPRLAGTGAPIRAFGRSLDRQWLAGHGVTDVHEGDLLDPAALDAAFAGARTVIHVGPGLQARETVIGQGVIDAAKRAGIAHFIYVSVIHPQIGQLMNHRAKLQVEDHLIDSRLTFTILQPQHYYQNVAVAQAVAQGQFGLPYSMERRLGFVDMADLAAAVVKVATEPGHDFATYEIASSEHLSGNDIADILSRASGTVVVPRQLPLAAALDWLVPRFAADDWSTDWTVDALTRLFTYYDRYGIAGNGNVLTWLLGRPPTSFAEYVDRELGHRPSA